jgi:ABC-type transport system involved in multi-copper enzyme maturation permease subunit
MSVPLPRSARVLRLEFKRNAVPYMLPLLVAVFYFDTLRRTDDFPPVWTLRASVIPNHMLIEFSAFAAGLAAWAGSREGRRRTLDLVATMPRAAWARLGAALAGTLGWLLLAFLAGVAVLYVQTALQATWGGPPLWPVLVGAAGATVVAVIGFTCGVLFPGRFTAPLVAIGLLVPLQAGFRQAVNVTTSSGTTSSGTYALLSPISVSPSVDTGLYYHVPPDVPIVQVLFMGGIVVALFGVLCLAPGGGRGSLRATLARGAGWALRVAAVILVACGVAASWTAFALAGTARPDAVGGWQIPALHSAASDQLVPVTPDCVSRSAFQVCVHPAFSFYLDDVATALGPVAAEIAGLPGAPVGAREVASIRGGQNVASGISGNPPVFDFTAEHVGPTDGEFEGVGATMYNRSDIIPNEASWREAFRQGLLDSFLTGPSQHAGFVPLDAAQQAVEDALLTVAGWRPQDSMSQTAGKPFPEVLAAINAAVRRFAGLPASTRHAWLAAHLAALRAGTITLARLP